MTPTIEAILMKIKAKKVSTGEVLELGLHYVQYTVGNQRTTVYGTSPTDLALRLQARVKTVLSNP